MITTLVFDYGRVLAYPKTRNWFITPNAEQILGFTNFQKELFSNEKIGQAFKSGNKYLNDNHLLHTEQEEYIQFVEFYRIILTVLGIEKNISDVCGKLAHDCVYNDDKVIFYDDVKAAMEHFKKTFKIVILSDTWPSMKRILENNGLMGLLDGLIMSCDYGITKESTALFEIAVSELNLVPKKCVFIDDSISNLENSEKVGFIPVLMDRNNKHSSSKYPIAKNMNDLSGIIADIAK